MSRAADFIEIPPQSPMSLDETRSRRVPSWPITGDPSLCPTYAQSSDRLQFNSPKGSPQRILKPPATAGECVTIS